DGKFGPKTFAALKACDPLMLAGAVYRQRRRYYEKIVANNPSQRVFLKGWMRRADSMAEASGVRL
ncbi:MAG: peptidoglycan-binding protein, partial [Synergistaceae bacterium]|nr:peptidoglycan-binding protein [Synergistaceae bacterium]